MINFKILEATLISITLLYHNTYFNRLEFLRRNSAKEEKEIKMIAAERRRRESQQ